VNSILEFGLRCLLIGALATLLMDAWAAALRCFGVPSLNFALLGRWLGHIPRGVWRHEQITAAVPVDGELLIGWCAHYLIGVSFAALLLALFGLDWARAPTLGPALGLGVGTVMAPLFVLQPAFGAGVASRKTPRPLFNSLKSLVTHSVFGVGLFLGARLTAALLNGL
jgi:hypothetical protein